MNASGFRMPVLAIVGLALAASPLATVRAEGPAAAAPDYEAQLAAIAPTVVTLKYIAVYDASNDYPAVCRGFLVDPSGLILLSNDNFGDGSVKIRDVKVLLGNDPKEWGAVIVARDKTLDLAYVQMLELEGKTLPAVELAKGRDPRIGENLFGVTRAGRGFDYAPALKRLYVTSRIESPRLFWDFNGEFSEAGLAAFDANGLPVGVIVNQQSAEGSDEDGGNHQDVFVLPLAAVLKSLGQAKQRVPDAIAKAKDAAKEPTKEPTKEPAKVPPGEPTPAPKEPPAMDDAGMGGTPPPTPTAPEPATPGPVK